ncbi:hypothetical protein SFMTTN_2787 [Sulfuriferula multivorans]|uniref:Uncharacterized protein n=1 Tax=Sulfuriferula multivorans TaxID=1559896 RepID=A0A401JYL3_9PROT|nr:hypothetical protein SFMTTN_2787 [Sulfuriferula multivorans]
MDETRFEQFSVDPQYCSLLVQCMCLSDAQIPYENITMFSIQQYQYIAI